MVNRRNIRVRKRRAGGSFIRQFLIGVLLVLVLSLIMGVLWFGTRLETLTIMSVSVEGGETVDRTSVKALVERELEGTYYRIVPKRFSWTYPEERIKQLVGAVDRVRTVELVRQHRRELIVRFSEYVPVALWCQGSKSRACAFLDNTGYAFTKAPALSGTAMLRYDNGQAPNAGDRPFSYEFMRDTRFLAAALSKDFGWSVAAVERIGSEEATFTLTGGGLIKTTMRQGVNDTLDNLRALVSSEEFRRLQPGNFQYIDLRFGDKVFVNEEFGQPDGELHASSTVGVQE